MAYGHYRRRHRGSSDDFGMGCIAIIILAMIALSAVGVYKLI